MESINDKISVICTYQDQIKVIIKMFKLFIFIMANLVIQICLDNFESRSIPRDDKTSYNYKHNYNYGTEINFKVISIFSLTIQTKLAEKSAKVSAAKKNNKLQHMKFGNHKSKKIKSHIKVMQINEGNSNVSTFKHLISNGNS